jgi:hypothetical protein
MKKITKRPLTLALQTIRELRPLDLGHVVGGISLMCPNKGVSLCPGFGC